ncbi:MAG: PLD nuclease N-terminal domain-containing protein, partial [Proteobacteria bacterium]|nr:PLD nuclease N-terminal domain-containing protein [Pseudomonadota bacterium]
MGGATCWAGHRQLASPPVRRNSRRYHADLAPVPNGRAAGHTAARRSYVGGPAMSAVWPALVAICVILVAGSASAHVILHKRDVRAAIGWVGLIWLVPFAGAGLYGLLGINRIQRRAAEL